MLFELDTEVKDPEGDAGRDPGAGLTHILALAFGTGGSGRG